MSGVVVVSKPLFSGVKGKRDVYADGDLICDSVFKPPVDLVPEVLHVQSGLRDIVLLSNQSVPKFVGVIHADQKFALIPGFGPTEAGDARACSATPCGDIALCKGAWHSCRNS
jgi:hypothetical protein